MNFGIEFYLSHLFCTMYLKDANGKQGRCFTKKECDESPFCDYSNETSSLDDLKDKCLYNCTCTAVSCDVNPSDEKMCNRYMISSSCNESTIEKKDGWNYYRMNSGTKKSFSYLKLINYNYYQKNRSMINCAQNHIFIVS